MSAHFGVALTCMIVTIAGNQPASGASQQKSNDQTAVSLHSTLHAGMELSYKHVTKVDQLLTGPRIRQRIMTDATMYVRVRVVSVDDDDSAQLELVHERITSDISTEPAQFAREHYDSDKQDTLRGDLALVYQPIVGKTIKLRVGPTGDVTVTRGVADVAVPQHARATFNELFSDAVVAATYADIFQTGTGTGKAEIGHSWQLVREQPDALGKKTMDLQLTLSQIEATHAVIGEKGEMKLEPDVGPQKPTVKLTHSTIEGTRLWDLTTGTLQSLKRNEVDKVQIRTLDHVDLVNTVTRRTEITRIASDADNEEERRAIE